MRRVIVESPIVFAAGGPLELSGLIIEIAHKVDAGALAAAHGGKHQHIFVAQREEIRALPHVSPLAAAFGQDIEKLPVQKIGRAVYKRLGFAATAGAADHVVKTVVLPHLRIAEAVGTHALGSRQHGVALVFVELDAVLAPGNALGLLKPVAVVAGAGVHHPQLVADHDGTAGKTAALGVIVVFFAGGQRHRKVIPVEQVLAHRMTPKHAVPKTGIGIVLIEEMILAFEVDQAVGVVQPAALGHEVVPLAVAAVPNALRVLGNVRTRGLDLLLHTLF